MVVWRCQSKNKCQWKRNQIHRNFLTWGRDRIGLKNNRLSGTCRKILNELYISASKCPKREEWDTHKKEENKDSPMVVNLVKKINLLVQETYEAQVEEIQTNKTSYIDT